jgi:hypothetical protein
MSFHISHIYKNEIINKILHFYKMSVSKIIQEFCRDLDPKHLSNIEYKHAVFFQGMSVIALKTENANHSIAKCVLKYYNMDYNGMLNGNSTNLLPPGDIKNTRIDLERLSIRLTGARNGDILMGAMPACNNSIIKVYGDIFPVKKSLDILRAYENTSEDMWTHFINRLGSIDFFSKMSIWERKMWLSDNEIIGNKTDTEYINVPVMFIQPGDGKSNVFSDLDENTVNEVMDKNPNRVDGLWTMQEFNEITYKERNKDTLLTLSQFWKVGTRFKIVDRYDDLVMNILNGSLTNGCIATNKEEIIIIGTITASFKKISVKGNNSPWKPDSYQNIGLLIPKKRGNPKVAFEIIKSRGVNIDEFKKSTIGFTAAAYKSLLQKIIRFMPLNVDIGNKIIMSGEHVILATVALLINHPGAFVPNIQRFVSGIESCAKRLAVTIYEDSSVTEDKYNDLTSLLACAMLKQRVKEWTPNTNIIKSWLDIAVSAYNNNTILKVDYNSEVIRKPYTLNENNFILKNASAVLDELKSFPTDLALARGWARNYPNIESEESKQIPKLMPIYHCIDQHWSPSFAYYYDPSLVLSENSKENTSDPFGPLFDRVFTECTGINPRLVERSRNFGVKDFDTFENIEFVKQTRKAQALFMIALQSSQKQRPKTSKTTSFNYEIPSGWLSGMIGPMEVKFKTDPNFKDPVQLKIISENNFHKQKYERELKNNPELKPPKYENVPTRSTNVVAIVTLKIDDPMEMVGAKKPSRDDKYKFVFSAEEEEKVFLIVRERLKRGVSMDKVSAPDEELSDCKVYLVENGDSDPYYAIQKNGNKNNAKIPWENKRYIKTRLPILEEMKNRDIEDALINIGDGVEENYMEKITHILDNVSDKRILRRMLVYLGSVESLIEMNRLSRNGGATKLPVNLLDVSVYQILLTISIIAPIALRPAFSQPATFFVPNGSVLWSIRSLIVDRTRDIISTNDIVGWKASRFTPDSGELKESQEFVVEQMIFNHKKKTRGNFIWVTVGGGKCLSPCTKALLWDGSIKEARNILVGDLLIGDNNKPRTVLSTCAGVDNMYKIKQHTGEDYIVNEPHILTLKYSTHKNITWCVENNCYILEWFDKKSMISCTKQFTSIKYDKNKILQSVLIFRETISDDSGIIDISVLDYLKFSKYYQEKFVGFKVGVDFSETDNNNISEKDSYNLGIWLVSDVDNIDFNEKTQLSNIINFYNLKNNKHIPMQYLRTSKYVKLQILAGILDSVGSCKKDFYKITNKIKILSDNICYLSRSLGFYVKCFEKLYGEETYYISELRGNKFI